jgi:hypothetical protein
MAMKPLSLNIITFPFICGPPALPLPFLFIAPLSSRLLQEQSRRFQPITRCNAEEEEDINELVQRLKMMSVHDQAYAHTCSIVVCCLPFLKDLLRAPLSVDTPHPSRVIRQ